MTPEDTAKSLVPISSPQIAGDRQTERMADPAQCPWCGEGRILERVGGVWICFVCSRTWR